MTLSFDTPLSSSDTLLAGGSRPSLAPVPLAGGQNVLHPRVSLANLTSFRVGGPAEWYIAPRNWEEVQASTSWARDRGLPLTFLGAGSNLLVSDRGLPGLTIATRYLRQVLFDDSLAQVTAGAGEPLPRLAWKAAKRGWRGLEWAVGIPGTVGGAVVMNAGAHRGCIADILLSALVLEPDGRLACLGPADLGYSYRSSVLQGGDRIVLQATFQLQPGGTRAEVMAETNCNLVQRKSSQPYHLPSCGSVFRNPDRHAAGWLIEQAGLKGYQIGGAQVAHRHANFILNCGNAKAQDIFTLIHHVQAEVQGRWSLSLQPEVRVLGEFDR